MRNLNMILNKIKKKLTSLLFILIGSFVLLLILWIIIYFLKPIIPQKYQVFITLISSNDWEASKNYIKDFFDSFGNFKLIIFIVIQLLQVLFAPIPGQLTGFLGGFLFGFWKGTLLTMIGLSIGSLMAMSIGRFLGKNIIRKFVPENILLKFDYAVKEEGFMNFFLIFLLPALPDDAVCFMAGLTRLSIWKLMIVCVLGRLPGMAVLTFIGSNVDTNILIAEAVLIIAIIISFIIWLFNDELKEYFYLLSKNQKQNNE